MDALTRIGQELGGPEWVQGPGGNVSVKEGDMLHVKASGKRLRDMMSWIREAKKDSSDPGAR